MSLVSQMKPKTVLTYLTLVSLLLSNSSIVFAESSVQNRKDIISIIGNQKHQSDTFGAIKTYVNKILFSGAVIISEVSYKIDHRNNVNTEETDDTTQANLEFWDKLQSEYPITEKPVFLSVSSICRPLFDYVPEGESEVIVTDNSGNPLDSYTIVKKERGLTLQKGHSSDSAKIYTITLNKLEELDKIYGKIGQFQACKKNLQNQIQNQA